MRKQSIPGVSLLPRGLGTGLVRVVRIGIHEDTRQNAPTRNSTGIVLLILMIATYCLMQRRSDMVKIKMAKVTLIDFSYLDRLALSMFTKGDPSI